MMEMQSKNRAYPGACRQQGFTLIEMLVAVAIFAVLSVTAVVGMNAVLSSRAAIEDNMDRLAEVQRTVLFLSRDLQQVVERGIRDQYGDKQRALSGNNTDTSLTTPIIELTRDGYPNPLGATRSSLQRVAYRIQDDTLYRATWPVLDRAQDTRPHFARLCRDLNALKIRYLDQGGNWHTQWPPQDTQNDNSHTAVPLPKAVEFTLDLKDWGPIVKLLPLAEDEI